MVAEETQARSHSSKKKPWNKLTQRAHRRQTIQKKKWHRRIALTARLIMVFTLDLVQIELTCIWSNSAIQFIPLLFIKLCSIHFKSDLLTRSHSPAFFSKALTSHVHVGFNNCKKKKRGQFLSFMEISISFLHESKATINVFDVRPILRLMCDAKWLLVAYPPFSWKNRRKLGVPIKNWNRAQQRKNL